MDSITSAPKAVEASFESMQVILELGYASFNSLLAIIEEAYVPESFEDNDKYIISAPSFNKGSTKLTNIDGVT
ncbi:hypothetical protein JCM19376_19750 [Fusibacter bizertensis]